MGIKDYEKLVGRFFKMRRNPTVWYVNSISKKRGSYIYNMTPIGIKDRDWEVECSIVYRQFKHPEGGWIEYNE